ncbi:response regulator transcription factor [Kibdelosporangium persicum]|uniref:Response regulator transcription factor n=1 Tax=Kibdelosporangium persicum TaxID=2698649 RepID=A0ABX2F200_9PSEU|nr:response regulator transcription factor [Kibdelosporangium persicum]NRN65257.1 Response regulator transcription factor [Kibdelosporangium persicum]
MIRVLLVDDQRLVRAGLRALCEPAPDVSVVGEAENGQQAVVLAERLLPDVVLMDLRMPGVDGVTATGRILAARPATRVVALTTFDDDDHLYPVLAAGACGFLVKDTSPAELLDGVRRAADGDGPFSPAVLRRLVRRAVAAHAAAGATAETAVDLTARERDVLALVGAGLSNAEIAERLHLGVTTVKTHLRGLLAKTGCANRARLAVYAAQAGVIPTP